MLCIIYTVSSWYIGAHWCTDSLSNPDIGSDTVQRRALCCSTSECTGIGCKTAASAVNLHYPMPAQALRLITVGKWGQKLALITGGSPAGRRGVFMQLRRADFPCSSHHVTAVEVQHHAALSLSLSLSLTSSHCLIFDLHIQTLSFLYTALYFPSLFHIHPIPLPPSLSLALLL